MSSTFFARIAELRQAVGEGDLVIKNEIDQVYAAYIEYGEGFKHPRGGQAHYARDGLYNHGGEYLEALAARAITPDGSELTSAAIDVGVRLKDETAQLTPREFVNLARSGHVSVIDDGEIVYDRPPDVPRLSEAQLRAQRRAGHDLDYGEKSLPRLEQP